MTSHLSFCIVGAGLTGSVIARELAERGHFVHVFDKRDHVAGNCHTYRHDTGIMVHAFGPHVFHTPHDHVWEYMNRFGEMVPFSLRTKTTVGSNVYSMPINLHTINQFFNKSMSPGEAKEFISLKTVGSPGEAISFKDIALASVGEELYESFFRGYTAKQWQMDPADLPASVFSRLPLRFNYDDSYFNHKWQGIPRHGYTEIVNRILDHRNISVNTNCGVGRSTGESFDHTIWTGPIDEYFSYQYGRLGYRTLDFKEVVVSGDYQGCPVMNYGDEGVPYTRITEHKYFTPWEQNEESVAFFEYSRQCMDNDTPYYPIRLVKEKKQLTDYITLSTETRGVTFAGRLGTYRYLDMDITIKEALDTANIIIESVNSGRRIPAFAVSV